MCVVRTVAIRQPTAFWRAGPEMGETAWQQCSYSITVADGNGADAYVELQSSDIPLGEDDEVRLRVRAADIDALTMATMTGDPDPKYDDRIRRRTGDADLKLLRHLERCHRRYGEQQLQIFKAKLRPTNAVGGGGM